jgi:hypothetical protein
MPPLSVDIVPFPYSASCNLTSNPSPKEGKEGRAGYNDALQIKKRHKKERRLIKVISYSWIVSTLVSQIKSFTPLISSASGAFVRGWNVQKIDCLLESWFGTYDNN